MLSLGQALPREALQALPVEEVLSACDHNGCSCFHWAAGRCRACRVCRVIRLVFVHFNISSAQVWRSGFLWNEKWHKSSAIIIGSLVLGHLDRIVSASDASFAVVRCGQFCRQRSFGSVQVPLAVGSRDDLCSVIMACVWSLKLRHVGTRWKHLRSRGPSVIDQRSFMILLRHMKLVS